jgi:hypothetical protein
MVYYNLNNMTKKKENTAASLASKFEEHRCRIVNRTDEFLIAVPLDWECAKFFNSFDNGKGPGWYIGDIDDPQPWNRFVREKKLFYFVYFYEKHPLYGRKTLIQYNCTANEFTEFHIDEEWDYMSFTTYGLLRPLGKEWELYAEIAERLAWYCYLRYEKMIHKQGFFDFDIFDNFDLSKKQIVNIGCIFEIAKIIYNDVKYSRDELLLVLYEDWSTERLFRQIDYYTQYDYSQAIIGEIFNIAAIIYSRGNDEKKRVLEKIDMIGKEWVERERKH